MNEWIVFQNRTKRFDYSLLIGKSSAHLVRRVVRTDLPKSVIVPFLFSVRPSFVGQSVETRRTKGALVAAKFMVLDLDGRTRAKKRSRQNG